MSESDLSERHHVGRAVALVPPRQALLHLQQRLTDHVAVVEEPLGGVPGARGGGRPRLEPAVHVPQLVVQGREPSLHPAGAAGQHACMRPPQLGGARFESEEGWRLELWAYRGQPLPVCAAEPSTGSPSRTIPWGMSWKTRSDVRP